MSTPSLNRVMKQEPPESDPVFNNVVPQEQQRKQQQQQQHQSVRIQQQRQQQWEQQLMKFTSDLTSLSSCICAFKNSFADLHKNLDHIHNSIFSLVSNLQQQQQLLHHHHPMPQAYPQTQSANISTDNVTTAAEAGPGSPPPPQLQTNTQTQPPGISTDNVSTAAEPDKKPMPLPPLPESNTEALSAENVSATTDEPEKPPAQMESGPGTDATDPAEPGPEPEYCPGVNPCRSSLDYLCRNMFGGQVRKYITPKLWEGDPNVVRQEVAASLKLAPNPAKLVLQCVGKCYTRVGQKRCRDKHKVARVLILESFLLLMGDCIVDGLDIELESAVEMEAKQDAVLWRSKMIREGGLAKANEIDARGLLFLLACFGIPAIFTDRELVTLVRLSNIKEILNALKGSRVLPPRLPGMIEVMSKNGSYAEAIELARSFGIEDKFSPKAILTTFLQETHNRMLWKMEKLSPVTLKESKRRLLDALKSVVKFVENQGQDLQKLCDVWQLKEKIVDLEREISQITNNLGDPKSIGRGKKKQKRKLGEVTCSTNAIMSEQFKRSCVEVNDPPLPTPPSVNKGLNEQQTGVIALRSLPHKDALHSCHLSNNASASVVSHTSAAPGVGGHPAAAPGVGGHPAAAPGVGGYPAAAHGLEARDAAGCFYARPSLRQPQPQSHGQISVSGNVVPRMIGGQGHSLRPQYGWNWPGSPGQTAWLNPASMMPASGGYYNYAPRSSNNHHPTIAP